MNVAAIEIIDNAGVEVVEISEEIAGVQVIETLVQGPAGATASFVAGETPSGAVDGVNATFTTVFSFVPESVTVFLNGLALQRIGEFNTSGNQTIIFMESPEVGDTIRVNYLKA